MIMSGIETRHIQSDLFSSIHRRLGPSQPQIDVFVVDLANANAPQGRFINRVSTV